MYRLFTGHAIGKLKLEGIDMHLQHMDLQHAAEETALPETKGIGYAQPSLELLSCRHCDAYSNCMIEQMTIDNSQSYQLLKNRKVYMRGQHIFRAEDKAEAIYVINSGSIKSYAIMEDGEEQVLNFYLTGDVFGLDGMGDNAYVSSTIALETTTICKLPLLNLPKQNLGQGFLKIISESLIRDHNLVLMLARKDANGRMASFLICMSKHYHKIGQPDDIINLTMTRHDIANYLGLAIETVSRTLRRFQDSGMLDVSRRKIQIYDFNSLLSIAGTQISR